MEVVQKNIQNLDHLALYDVMKFIEEAIGEGYSVPDINNTVLFPRRHGPGSYYIAMVKDEDNTEEVVHTRLGKVSEEEVREAYERAKTQADFRHVMNLLGMNLPEKEKNPISKARKYVRETLEGKGIISKEEDKEQQ